MKRVLWGFLIAICSVIAVAHSTYAVGNISSSNHSAMLKRSPGFSTSTYSRLINFGVYASSALDQYEVEVTDTELTGYIWGTSIGWISLNCGNNNGCGDSNFKVTNNGSGVLSGYGWGQLAGWVNFAPSQAGVRIDGSTGQFSGHAWSQNFGWIEFSCSATSTCTETTWRATIAPDDEGATGGSGGTYINSTVARIEEMFGSSTPLIPGVLPACIDGKDNDNDGKTDMFEDPGCSSMFDNNESNVNVPPSTTPIDIGVPLTLWPDSAKPFYATASTRIPQKKLIEIQDLGAQRITADVEGIVNARLARLYNGDPTAIGGWVGQIWHDVQYDRALAVDYLSKLVALIIGLTWASIPWYMRGVKVARMGIFVPVAWLNYDIVQRSLSGVFLISFALSAWLLVYDFNLGSASMVLIHAAMAALRVSSKLLVKEF